MAVDLNALVTKVAADSAKLATDSATVASDSATLATDVKALQDFVAAIPPPPPTLSITASPSTAVSGSTITVSYTGASVDPAVQPWIGPYVVGAPPGSYGEWHYTTGASGSLSFVAPSTAGNYEFRMYPNSTWALLATSNTVAVSAASNPPPPPSNVVTAVLNFADGTSATYSEDKATDLGVFDTGLMQVRNKRQISTEQGTYRGAFHVDFRTDQNGKKQVIVEYGTRMRFPANSAPIADNGVTPQHLFFPPPAVISSTPGNTSGQSGSCRVSLSWVKPDGESLAGFVNGDTGITLNAGDRLVVKSPPAFGNATGYKVYARLLGSSDARYLQTPTAVPIGTDWVCPPAGLALSGAYPLDVPDFPAYTVTVSGGPLTAPVVVSVPYQPYGTRFRAWVEQAPAVQRTYAQLVAMKAILPMAMSAVPGIGLLPPITWKGPMDTAAIDTGMADTGERPEIGLVPSYAVGALLSNDPAQIASCMAQGEAVGSFPFWARNADKPGAPLASPDDMPLLAFYDTQGGHSIPAPAMLPVYSKSVGLDVSHIPALSYIPYMMTGDPWHFEGVQASGMYAVTTDNYARATNNLPRLVTKAQPRAIAWAWRDLFRAASYTPATVPSWIVPKSVFTACVPDQVTHGNLFLNNTASPLTTVFKWFNNTSITTAFMLEYLCHAAAEIINRGDFPEMKPLFDYVTTPRIALSNGTSGWDRRYQELYYTAIVDARLKGDATGAPELYGAAVANPNTPTSWAELFTDTNAMAIAQGWSRWNDAATAPANRVSGHQSGYLTITLSSLAVLSQVGYNTREAYDWLFDQLYVKQWPDVNVWQYLHWTYLPK